MDVGERSELPETVEELQQLVLSQARAYDELTAEHTKLAAFYKELTSAYKQKSDAYEREAQA